MRLQWGSQLLKLCVGLAVIGLIAGVSAACKKKSAETEGPSSALQAPEPIANLRAILGEAKEDYPGVQDIEQEGKALVIYYRFIPKDTNTLQEELGEDLAPKIKKIYQTEKAVDVLRFDVSIPFTEESGATGFKSQLSFAITRKIFDETDWSGLLDRDFLKIVQDLRSEK
jgi:hypothetical protein